MARDAYKRQEQGERLRELRGPLGNGRYKIKQDTVADFVGVSTRAYQGWEGGTSEIKWENVEKLAAFFDRDPHFILHGGEQTQLDRIEAKLDAVLAALATPLTPEQILALAQVDQQANGKTGSSAPSEPRRPGKDQAA